MPNQHSRPRVLYVPRLVTRNRLPRFVMVPTRSHLADDLRWLALWLPLGLLAMALAFGAGGGWHRSPPSLEDTVAGQ